MDPKEELLKLLQELSKYEFKHFKSSLNSLPVIEGKSNVPRGHLDDADHVDTMRLMDAHYGEITALQITAKILKSIPRIDLLDKVKAYLQRYSLELELMELYDSLELELMELQGNNGGSSDDEDE